MKKVEWLIAIFIMVMGIICMMVSATSFRGMSFLQLGQSVGTFCIWFAGLLLMIGLIYIFLKHKRKP
ncbi:hypothetical protein [Paenibacillus glacialis]|uniref:Uncharacterized protein n=1 Tax=Paenibacillus glacialis TaxID=494026 RepID=A0A168P1K6_9BACL|nr:hypothetical protein [Paenibacillus glacialis]OAB46298.1 hypothetical protein PGLA_02660 [Paenibacillus glacialis]